MVECYIYVKKRACERYSTLFPDDNLPDQRQFTLNHPVYNYSNRLKNFLNKKCFISKYPKMRIEKDIQDFVISKNVI